jgi:hypothetical protein
MSPRRGGGRIWRDRKLSPRGRSTSWSGTVLTFHRHRRVAHSAVRVLWELRRLILGSAVILFISTLRIVIRLSRSWSSVFTIYGTWGRAHRATSRSCVVTMHLDSMSTLAAIRHIRLCSWSVCVLTRHGNLSCINLLVSCRPWCQISTVSIRFAKHSVPVVPAAASSVIVG